MRWAPTWPVSASPTSRQLSCGSKGAGLESCILSTSLIDGLLGCALCRRPLAITHNSKTLECLQADASCLVRKLAIWHVWCLHFGVLGDPETILEHLGSTRQDTLASRLEFPLISGYWGDPILRAIQAHRIEPCVFVPSLVSRYVL